MFAFNKGGWNFTTPPPTRRPNGTAINKITLNLGLVKKIIYDL